VDGPFGGVSPTHFFSGGMATVPFLWCFRIILFGTLSKFSSNAAMVLGRRERKQGYVLYRFPSK